MENHKLHELCRVCLSPNGEMLPLDNRWESSSADKNPSSIANILETVMSVKIQSTKCPNRICQKCKKDLEISYKLYCVFHRSQDLLDEWHKAKNGNNLNTRETEVSKESVELVINGNSFSLNDILIVEEESKDVSRFEGFLKNLGHTVSVHFAKNQTRRKDLGKPENLDNFEEIQIVVIDEPEDNKEMDGNEPKLTETESDEESNSKNTKMMEFESQNIDSMHTDDACNETLQQCGISDQIVEDYPCTIDQGLVLSNESCNGKTQPQPDVAHTTNELIQEASIETQIFSNFSDPESSNKEVQMNGLIENTCSFCGQVTAPARQFKNGQIACEPCNLLVFDCEHCDFAIDSRTEYIKHMETHSRSRFKCDLCEKKFVAKSSLNVHIRNHHTVNTYLCTVCGKLVNDNSGFLYHMKMHTNEWKYCCSHCGRKFRIRSHLMRHERTHRGIRPYKCTRCDKAFFTSTERRRHELVHFVEKPLKCKYCNAVFSRRDHRRLHHMSHSGPHICVYCRKTFIEMSCLQDHLNLKHKEELVT